MGEKIVIKGDTFKDFEITLKDWLLDDRKKYNIYLTKLRNDDYVQENGFFPISVDIIQICTNMTDEQVNILVDDEIYAIALRLIDIKSKKKSKK